MDLGLNRRTMLVAAAVAALALLAGWLIERRDDDDADAFVVLQTIYAEEPLGGSGFDGLLNGIRIDPRETVLQPPPPGCRSSSDAEFLVGEEARSHVETAPGVRIPGAAIPGGAVERFIFAHVCRGEVRGTEADFVVAASQGAVPTDLNIQRIRGNIVIHHSASKRAWQSIEVLGQSGVATGTPGSGSCFAAIYAENTDVMTTVSATLEDLDFCIEIIEGVVS